MKISLDWINDYVDIKDLDTEWLIKKLTVTTAEIEGMERIGGDVIIEIDNKSLTNRPDLWCHYGMAREISAITGRALRDIACIAVEELKSNRPALDVHIETGKKCLRYAAIKIDNVRAETSPVVIAVRLANCGIRPINIIVDIANYVMLDVGQPLHTFDGKDIGLIRVSSLREDIKFKTLDNVERDIPAETLMIFSQDKPLAAAGIIGGEESAVSENTCSIILESATFDGVAVRKTAQSLGIRTDASARYEKFLDIALTTMAVGRYLKILKMYQPEIEIASSLYDNIISEVKPLSIRIAHSYIETYLGNSIETKIVEDILRRLQFDVVSKDGIYDITVPTFRATKDITCKADIIEEILRVYGYENINGRPYRMEVVPVEKDTVKELAYKLKDLLVNKFNFNEIHSYPWYDSQWLKKLGYDYENCLKIVNSGIKQFEKLRSDIAPNILKIIYDNRANYEEIRIFEIGRVFIMKDGELLQPRHLTLGIYSIEDVKESYRYVKGIASYLIRNVKNIEPKYVQIASSSKDNSLIISYDSKELGQIYSAPSSILRLYKSKHIINILDIDLESLNSITRQEIRYKQLPKYPETYLDFSILTSIDTSYYEIQCVVNKFKHPLLLKSSYIDTYIGENVPENMKSTTFRIVIGDSSRTLQAEEVNEVKDVFMEYLRANGMGIR